MKILTLIVLLAAGCLDTTPATTAELEQRPTLLVPDHWLGVSDDGKPVVIMTREALAELELEIADTLRWENERAACAAER